MKRSINFYQESLKPAQDPLPLTLVVKIVAVTAVILALIIALQSWRANSSESHLNKLRMQHAQASQTMNGLSEQLQAHRNTDDLEQQLSKLKQATKYRQELLLQLDTKQGSKAVSYSEFMRDLARFHNPNVWLRSITASQQQFALEGATQSPADIPRWIQNLRQSEYFKGRELSTLEFASNDGVRQFKVATLRTQEQQQ